MHKHTGKLLKQKQKIEREPEEAKPAVINDTLIEQYMVTYHKENQIYDRDEMRIWELTHLSLSYKSKFHFAALIIQIQTWLRSTTLLDWKT